MDQNIFLFPFCLPLLSPSNEIQETPQAISLHPTIGKGDISRKNTNPIERERERSRKGRKHLCSSSSPFKTQRCRERRK